MYQIRYVYNHYQVYSPAGRFLFSADTENEAWEELAALARKKVPETVPGELPALDELHFTRNPNHGSWTVEWFDGGGVRHRVRVYGSLGERVTLYQVKLGCW